MNPYKKIKHYFALQRAGKYGAAEAKNESIDNVKFYIEESEKAIHGADYKMAFSLQNRALKELLHLATWKDR